MNKFSVLLFSISIALNVNAQYKRKYNYKNFSKKSKNSIIRPLRKSKSSTIKPLRKSNYLNKNKPSFKNVATQISATPSCPDSLSSGVRGVVRGASGMTLKSDGCYKLTFKKRTSDSSGNVCWRGPKNGTTQVKLSYGQSSCNDPGFTLCANEGLDIGIWPDSRIKSASTVQWKLNSTYQRGGDTYCKYKMNNGTEAYMTYTIK